MSVVLRSEQNPYWELGRLSSEIVDISLFRMMLARILPATRSKADASVIPTVCSCTFVFTGQLSWHHKGQEAFLPLTRYWPRLHGMPCMTPHLVPVQFCKHSILASSLAAIHLLNGISDFIHRWRVI